MYNLDTIKLSNITERQVLALLKSVELKYGLTSFFK